MSCGDVCPGVSIFFSLISIRRKGPDRVWQKIEENNKPGAPGQVGKPITSAIFADNRIFRTFGVG